MSKKLAEKSRSSRGLPKASALQSPSIWRRKGPRSSSITLRARKVPTGSSAKSNRPAAKRSPCRPMFPNKPNSPPVHRNEEDVRQARHPREQRRHLRIRAAGKVTAEHFHKQFDLNVLGLLLATQEAAKLFGSGGGIINISSSPRHSAAATAVYSATKAAVVAITKALAKELGPRKIRVNSINPGMVETEGPHRRHRRQRFP